MREAVRRGIERARLEPRFVNEDLAPRPESSRNACLNEVDGSDIFVILIGERGGSTAKSGKLIIEEEYERAVSRRLPILVFLQNVPRDPEAERLAERLSDYVDGHFRASFNDASDLEEQVFHAAKEQGAQVMRPSVPASEIESDLAGFRVSEQKPSLRLVISPERAEEVVSIVEMERGRFWFDVNERAHSKGVEFFSYGSQTSKETTEDGMLFTQASNEGYGRDRPEAAIEIRSNGRLILDKAIIPEPERSRVFVGDALLESDLERTIGRALAFSSAFYDKWDPSKRQSSFWLAALIASPGMSYLLPEPPRDGTPINLRSRQERIVIAEPARPISRHDLGSPAGTTERLMVQFRRKLGPPGNRR